MSTKEGQVENIFGEIFNICLPESEKNESPQSLIPMVAAFADLNKNTLVYLSTINRHMAEKHCSGQLRLVLKFLRQGEQEIDVNLMSDWSVAGCRARVPLKKSDDFDKRITMIEQYARQLDDLFCHLEWPWFMACEVQESGQPHVNRFCVPTSMADHNERFHTVSVVWAMLKMQGEFTFEAAAQSIKRIGDSSEKAIELATFLNDMDEEENDDDAEDEQQQQEEQLVNQ